MQWWNILTLCKTKLLMRMCLYNHGWLATDHWFHPGTFSSKTLVFINNSFWTQCTHEPWAQQQQDHRFHPCLLFKRQLCSHFFWSHGSCTWYEESWDCRLHVAGHATCSFSSHYRYKVSRTWVIRAWRLNPTPCNTLATLRWTSESFVASLVSSSRGSDKIRLEQCAYTLQEEASYSTDFNTRTLLRIRCSTGDNSPCAWMTRPAAGHLAM